MVAFITSAVQCASPHRETAACGYQIRWVINPHMVLGGASLPRAAAQHARLRRTVESVGALVIEVPFVHGAFDSVFAKDNAVYASRDGQLRALLANPRYDVRKIEQQVRARDLGHAGVTVQSCEQRFEGGDVCMLPGKGGAVVGYGFRSAIHAVAPLREFFDLPVTALELVDPALYHLDTAFTVLDDGTALICAGAFSPASRRAIDRLPLRDVIEVSRDAATQFALNFVQIGDTVVTGTDSPEVESVLRSLGKRVLVTPLDEFQRAGGSAACLLGRIHEVGAVMHAATAAIRSTAA